MQSQAMFERAEAFAAALARDVRLGLPLRL
jgi:hypothetical protein